MPDASIAWATKGFEPGTGRFLHELVAEQLPGRAAAVVTGPSFASEVAAGLPSAVTVHSDDDAFAQQLASLLHAPNLRAYSGSDVLGAELGGAMKNVLAVATGVADGMQLGLNARAGLITRGMNEMLRLGVALGRRAGNPDGPVRPRRPGADLHRRPVAQPAARSGAGAGRGDRRGACARSARWWRASSPPTKWRAWPTSMAWTCRSAPACAPCCMAR